MRGASQSRAKRIANYQRALHKRHLEAAAEATKSTKKGHHYHIGGATTSGQGKSHHEKSVPRKRKPKAVEEPDRRFKPSPLDHYGHPHKCDYCKTDHCDMCASCNSLRHSKHGQEIGHTADAMEEPSGSSTTLSDGVHQLSPMSEAKPCHI